MRWPSSVAHPARHNLLTENYRRQNAYIDHLSEDDNKAAFYHCRRLVQQRLREMQNARTARKAKKSKGTRTKTDGRTSSPPPTVRPPKVLHLSSAPTEEPRSLRKHKFFNDRPNNLEASSIATQSSPTPSSPASPKTVQQLSSGKAPASDASSAEVYKHDCPKFMEHLTALFQETRRQGEVPQDFKDVTIIHLHKRIGNRQLYDNHRGIFLLKFAVKIFAHILLNRLSNRLDQGLLSKRQCGFLHYRGAMDRIFSTHQLHENCQEMRTHLHFTFMDLMNAFDWVICDEVWKIMR
ncbi:hypothetical protein SprV_1002880500 [Sparganum proliferum]